MTQVPPATPESSPTPVVPVCYRHPRRETYVRCVRCDRPICPECLNEAPVGFQCPECIASGRRSMRPTRTVFGGSTAGEHGYVTKALIAINVAVLLLATAVAGGRGLFGGQLGGLVGGSTDFTQAGAVKGVDVYKNTATGAQVYVPTGIADGEYYRLFTSLFLHYGLIHLLLNMWALWVLGRELESRLGPVRFSVLYLVSGLGGSVACYVFAPQAQAAGASGAIYGLFAALFIVFRRLNRDTSAIITILVINLVLSFSVPGISIEAHLGGLVTGAVLGVVLAYAPKAIRNRVLVGTVAALTLFFTAVVIAQTVALNALTVPSGF